MPLSLKGKPRRPVVTDDPEEFRATLVEHLEDLRDRIVRSLVILCVAWVGGWYAEPPLYKAISDVIATAIRKRMPPDTVFQVIFSHVSDAFMLKVKLSFMIGLLIAFPLIVVQLWGFITPGLKVNERKAVSSVAPASVVLFALGVFFSWLILPSAFTWFTSYMDEFHGTSLLQEAGVLVFFVVKLMLAFGVGFQLPLVVFVLGKIGLLSPETLIRNWRQAAVGIFVVSAIVTPSNDPITMLMMAVPLSLLFICSVYAVKYTAGKALKEAERESGDSIE